MVVEERVPLTGVSCLALVPRSSTGRSEATIRRSGTMAGGPRLESTFLRLEPPQNGYTPGHSQKGLQMEDSPKFYVGSLKINTIMSSTKTSDKRDCFLFKVMG